MIVKKMQNKLRSRVAAERGSISLESAIVFPFIFMVVCLSIYIVLLLFEQAQLQASSDYAAQRISSAWRGDVHDASLYHRFFDSEKEKKVKTASGVAETRLGELALPGYTQAIGDAVYKNSIFGKNLAVGLSGNTTLPNKDVTSVFGYSNVFGGRYAAKSLMPDFAENIRCIGYVVEIEKKIEEASPEFAEVASNFSDILTHIRGFIGGQLN